MSTLLDVPPVTSMTFCWTVERNDGAGLALTSLDHDVQLGETRFSASAGPVPSAIAKGAPGEALTEIRVQLGGSGPSVGDVIAGRWDGAKVSLHAFDWKAPGASLSPLVAGMLGDLALEGAQLSAELLGAAAKLKAPVCPFTSPECRADLGDRRCRVDMAGRTTRVQVQDVVADAVVVSTDVDDRFCMGYARWVRGKNSGESSAILSAEGRSIVLRDQPTNPVSAGDALVIVEGCDKRFETCIERFDNAVNFQGEPHLPGNDLLTRYPGS